MVHDGRYRHDVEQPSTREYEVAVNGITTTMRLSDADAKARGLIKGTEAVVDPAAPVAIVRQSVSDEDPNLPNVGTTQTTDPYASAGAVGDGTGEVGTIADPDDVGPTGGVAVPEGSAGSDGDASGDGDKAAGAKRATAANKGGRAANKGGQADGDK